MTTIRLTMAQALIRYLAAQTSEIDGREVPLFAGVFAIFGHGNVAGVGEALYEARERLPTLRAHNEQAMGLAAIGFAKASRRRRMMACTSSIGPGATSIPDLDREVKWHCKYARQNGIHVSPTFMIDGLVQADMSSGDPIPDWVSRLLKQ